MKDVRPLATFLFLNAVVLNLVLVVLPWTPQRKTVFNNTARFLTASAGTDSWGEMHVALDVARREPARPLYSEVFLRRHIRFPYAPPSLLLTAAVERLPVSAERFLNALSWLAVLATAAVVARLFRQSGGAGGGTLSISLLAAGFTLTFYPIVKGFTLGQIQTAINLLLAVALLQWVDGRTGAAGVLAALPCLVKPQYALVLLWGVVRREWRFSMAFAVTVRITPSTDFSSACSSMVRTSGGARTRTRRSTRGCPRAPRPLRRRSSSPASSGAPEDGRARRRRTSCSRFSPASWRHRWPGSTTTASCCRATPSSCRRSRDGRFSDG